MYIFNVCLFAGEFESKDNTYKDAAIPDFLPHIGRALPGRCYLTIGSNKKIPSVLMVSFEDEGFELAPFDNDKTRDAIFDHLTYEEVLKQFPLIKQLFMPVSETAEGAIIEKSRGSIDYKAEIRESAKFMIMRVYINNKMTKICNYLK